MNSEKRTFYIEEELDDAIKIVFKNRFGCYDILHVPKYTEINTKNKPNRYKSYLGEKVNDVELEFITTYTSTYLNEAEFAWLQDLKASNEVYINDEAVIIETSTSKINNYDATFWVLEITVKTDFNSL